MARTPQMEWRSFDPSKVTWPTWLIEGVLPERSTICLYGDANVGKTFLALDFALSISTGKEWLGPKLSEAEPANTPRKVAYLLAEGPDGLTRRTMGWLKCNGVSFDKGEAMLDGMLHLPKGSCLLDKPADLDALIESLEAKCKDLSLLVLDPLASFMAGDENSTRDMQAVIHAMRKIVDRFGCSVLVVHHTGKNRYKGERGSSALKGGLDTLLSLIHFEKSGDIVLEVEKQRDASKLKPITLGFSDEEDDQKRQLGRVPYRGTPRWKQKEEPSSEPGATEVAIDKPPMESNRARTAREKAERLMNIIQEALASPDAPQDGYVPIQAILAPVAGMKNYGDTAVEEALDKLVKAGKLRKHPRARKYAPTERQEAVEAA